MLVYSFSIFILELLTFILKSMINIFLLKIKNLDFQSLIKILPVTRYNAHYSVAGKVINILKKIDLRVK